MKQFSITPECKYYFCTDTIWGWQHVFTSEPFFHIIIESWNHCRKNKGLNIHGYVIMPNHIHSILSSMNGDLSSILRDYKRFTSNEISQLLQETNNTRLINYFSTAAELTARGDSSTIWQRGSHPIGLVSQDFYHQKLKYMHDNPVRKGYVCSPEHWKYSSARNYILNDNSIFAIDLLS